MKDDLYYLHQTPKSLCIDIVNNIVFKNDNIILEPFAGENNFYDGIPNNLNKYRAEIEDGLCYKSFDYENIKPNIIISNPPFKINGKNAFYDIMLFFAKINSITDMYILCSAYCYDSLTPKRMKSLNENNLYINAITIYNVKKWSGRYKLIHFTRQENKSFKYVNGIFE